jgi:hypothetical protein
VPPRRPQLLVHRRRPRPQSFGYLRRKPNPRQSHLGMATRPRSPIPGGDFFH